jgi:hypothetical protein
MAQSISPFTPEQEQDIEAMLCRAWFGSRETYRTTTVGGARLTICHTEQDTLDFVVTIPRDSMSGPSPALLKDVSVDYLRLAAMLGALFGSVFVSAKRVSPELVTDLVDPQYIATIDLTTVNCAGPACSQ